MIQQTLFESTLTASKKSLTERVVAGVAADRVDRENGIIRDVAILGRDSQNRRIYEDPALEKAVVLYEGAPVRPDHKPGCNRSMTEDVGFLTNLRLSDQKVRGDFRVIKSHPLANYIFDRAEQFPNTFGFSHEAEGLVEDGDDDVDHVVDLLSVESVDLVSAPATNRSLFEEKLPMKTRKSIRSVVRGAPANTPGRKLLMEMIGDPAMDGEMEYDSDAAPAEQMDLALKAAVLAILDNTDLDSDGKLSALRSLIGAGEVQDSDETSADATGDGGASTEAVSEEDPPAGGAATERQSPDDQQKQTAAVQESISQLRKEFKRELDARDGKIKSLQEQLDAADAKVKAADNEREVRRIFEESGVKSPTQMQVKTAMNLKGSERDEFVETVKQLVESQSAGGEVRSSGGGNHRNDSSSYEETRKSWLPQQA